MMKKITELLTHSQPVTNFTDIKVITSYCVIPSLWSSPFSKPNKMVLTMFHKVCTISQNFTTLWKFYYDCRSIVLEFNRFYLVRRGDSRDGSKPHYVTEVNGHRRKELCWYLHCKITLRNYEVFWLNFELIKSFAV